MIFFALNIFKNYSMVLQIVFDSVLRVTQLYDKSFDPQIVKYITAWWMNREQEPSVEEMENLLSFFLMDYSDVHVSMEDLLDSNVFEPDEFHVETRRFSLRTELFG